MGCCGADSIPCAPWYPTAMGSEWSLSLAGDERFVFNPAEAVGHFALNLAAPWDRMVSPGPAADVGRGRPLSSDADMGGMSPVTMQMWEG